jgi:hypothetical protein
MCEERSKYITELEEKEYLIEELYEEIQDIRRNLEQLEQNDVIKTKKIKLLREENLQLSVELELSSMTTTHKEKSERHDLDETIRLNSANSVASSIPNRSFISFIESDHFFQSEADKTYFSEKIEEIERIHKE